jgi:hypothetical protein
LALLGPPARCDSRFLSHIPFRSLPQPFLFLWAPPKSIDHHLRQYQHYYFPVLYSLLYVSWRTQSAQWAFRNRDWKTIFLSLAPGYIWYTHCLLSRPPATVLERVPSRSPVLLFPLV